MYKAVQGFKNRTLNKRRMLRRYAFCRKSPINQRFLRFRQKNGCVFLFPQSGYEGTGLLGG
nr:MAG TPA: hypothetical protein [Caudoviricetes sp.]